MSTDRDVTRIVRSWLEVGVTTLPDRVLDNVLDQLPATSQRRAPWPVWRLLQMNMPARIATVAAAVALVAVIGAIAIPKGGGTSGPGASPSPTPTPTPTPSPIALPLNPLELTVTESGTYLAGDPFQIPITMSVPAGWVGKVGGPYAAYLDRAPVGNGDAYIEITLSQNIYADPCHDRGFLAPQPGPTVDDLAAALARQPGLVAAASTEVTVDGYSGKQLTLTAPASFAACTLSPDGYRLWRLPLGGIFSFNPGQHATLRIVDVKGKRLVISSNTFPTTNAQELAELQGIVDSIRIEPNN
jgi:hypothetical protein